jgi:hypothetical protein
VTFPATLNLNFNPEKLSEIKFNNGTSIDIGASFNDDNLASVFDIEIELTSFKKDGVPLKRTVSPGQQTSINLGTYVANLDSNKFDVNVKLIEKPHAAATIVAGTNLNLELNFTNIGFKYIRGFLGTNRTPTALPEQSVDVQAFGDALKQAHIKFADAGPELSYTFTSGYGIPLTIDFSPFEVKKTDGRARAIKFIGGNSVFIDNNQHREITVDSLGSVFNFGPEQFHFQMAMSINKGLTTGDNFCADTSKLSVKLHAKMPIWASAADIVLADTFQLDLSGAKDSRIESAQLHSVVENQLPVDAYMQMYFADDNYNLLDSVFASGKTALIKASTVNVNGELVEKGVSDVKIDLSKEKLSRVFDAKKLIFKLSVNTTKENDGSQRPVQFKSKYKIDLKMSLEAKLKLLLGESK